MTDAPHPKQWLAAQLAKLNQALDDVLDVEAGLRDAQLPRQRTELDHVLDDVLDVEAGLNALLPPSRAPQPSLGSSQEQAAAPRDDGTPALALAAYARRLMTSPGHIRLTTRAQLPHRELAKVNSAVLSRLLAEADNRDVALAIHVARDLARHLANTLGIIRSYSTFYRRDLIRGRAHARDLTIALAHARDLALDAVPRLARTLADAHDTVTAIRRDLLHHDGNLELAIDLVHDLALALDRTHTPGLEAALIRAYVQLQPTHDLAEALDQDLGYGRAHGFDEPFATALAEALAWLTEATTDFTESDLASVDLEGVPLQGLRWSSTTQWPPGWEELIRQASVQLEPDLYEIRDDPRIRSHLT